MVCLLVLHIVGVAVMISILIIIPRSCREHRLCFVRLPEIEISHRTLNPRLNILFWLFGCILFWGLLGHLLSSIITL
jgi:hypothetical protein